MTNKITIRRATVTDIPLLLENWKELMHLNARMHSMYKLNKNYASFYPPFLRKRIKSRKAVAFIAEVNGKLAGYALVELQKLPKCYTRKSKAYILELFIKNEYRKKGIATRLLREAQKWGKKRHADQLELSVNAENKAARLCYEKFGLEPRRFSMIKEI